MVRKLCKKFRVLSWLKNIIKKKSRIGISIAKSTQGSFDSGRKILNAAHISRLRHPIHRSHPETGARIEPATYAFRTCCSITETLHVRASDGFSIAFLPEVGI